MKIYLRMPIQETYIFVTRVILRKSRFLYFTIDKLLQLTFIRISDACTINVPKEKWNMSIIIVVIFNNTTEVTPKSRTGPHWQRNQ